MSGKWTIRAFLDLGALDRLGMVILPVLLGSGIPLFALDRVTFSPDAWAASQAAGFARVPRPLLRLDRQRAFPDGAVELAYVPA